MAAVSKAQLIKNSITFQQFHYATLDCTPPSQTAVDTQSEFIQLPPGWCVAPNHPDIVKHIVSKYPWGTHMLVLEDGNAYNTSLLLFKTHQIKNALLWAVNCLKPSCAMLRILIRTSSNEPEAPCAQLGAKLWAEKQFCDCEVVCGELAIQCHRAVLASGSVVCERMLSSEMQEASQRQIVIRDAAPKAVEALLKFMYTGECCLDDDNVAPLLDLADLYQVEHLVKLCATYGLQHVNVDNVQRIKRSLRSLRDRDGYDRVWSDFIKKVKASDALLEKLLE